MADTNETGVSHATMTSWNLIADAAEGRDRARGEFATRYAGPLRAFFRHRWRAHTLASDVEDAVQDVLLDCLRDGGALSRAERRRDGGFRAFLYGIARKTALRFEQKLARKRELQPVSAHALDKIDSDDTSLSLVFDRAWARGIVRQAVELQQTNALHRGKNAARRAEVMRLRFRESMSPLEIAQRLGLERTQIYKDLARGKEEFRHCLAQAVGLHFPECGHVEKECVAILRRLA